MGSKIDLTGRRYGRLLVLAEGEHRNKRIYWICKCDCGKTKQINGSHLRRGNISSCGCISKEGNHVTHGLSKRNRLYRIWGGIKSRCDNPNVPSYKHYGARGISVCEEWRDYKAFHEWAVSNGYSEELRGGADLVEGGLVGVHHGIVSVYIGIYISDICIKSAQYSRVESPHSFYIVGSNGTADAVIK